MSKRHTVTVDEFSAWVNEPQWHTFASSHCDGANKSLGYSSDGHFRVRHKGETIYLGGSATMATAVEVYNDLP